VRARPPCAERLKSFLSAARIFNSPRLSLQNRRSPHVEAEEAVTATGTNRDFASLLDDLLVDAEEPEQGPRPTIPFDYLAVAEELHSGRIRLAEEAAAAEYREAGNHLEAELKAFLDETSGLSAELASEEQALSSVEPEAIASELGLDNADQLDFGKLRRRFALQNHPDLVAPHLRQHALQRMQVANGMIDDAKARALTRGKS